MHKDLPQRFNHMTAGEIKAEWNLILVKKKRKQDRRYF